MKTIIKQLGVAVAIISATSAFAVPTLTISDGTTTVTILDNQAGDAVGLAGVVSWTGSVGNWFLNIDTGTTKPVFGSSSSPDMDLSFYGASASAGTLTLTFTDDGFDFSGGLIDAWGGTAAGTVLNRVLKNSDVLIAQGPLGPGAFSSTAGGTATLTSQDTLSLVVVITHQGAGLTTGDKHVSVPDGGSSLLLLGLGLLGLVGIRRKA